MTSTTIVTTTLDDVHHSEMDTNTPSYVPSLTNKGVHSHISRTPSTESGEEHTITGAKLSSSSPISPHNLKRQHLSAHNLPISIARTNTMFMIKQKWHNTINKSASTATHRNSRNKCN